MVGHIEKSAGGNFAPTAEGVHLMICRDVLDIGTQPGSAKYPAPKRKIVIRWEIPEIRVEWEVEGEMKSGPALHMEKYTWSFHENANLRSMLESWRGKVFTEDDFAGPPNGFHIKNLIGAPMRGQIMHEENGGKVFANLKSTMAAGFKTREEWPELEGAASFLDLDNFDQSVFDRLSEYWQETIKKSPEYQALFSQSPEGFQGQSENPAHGITDDEIPF